MRKEKGVTTASVYRDAKEPNTIIITHKFKDMNTAMMFANAEELKAAMANAGVSAPPEIWFGEDVEQTPY